TPGPLKPPPADAMPAAPAHVFVAQPHGTLHLHVAVRRDYQYDVRGRVRLAGPQVPFPVDYQPYDDVPPGVIPTPKSLCEAVYKTGTDVIVQGAAHTYGHPVPETDVSVT